MYKISQEQIESIKNAFYTCNAPVQMFQSLTKVLSELPRIESDVEDKEEKQTKKQK